MPPPGAGDEVAPGARHPWKAYSEAVDMSGAMWVMMGVMMGVMVVGMGVAAWSLLRRRIRDRRRR
jgi:hypothetical protein